MRSGNGRSGIPSWASISLEQERRAVCLAWAAPCCAYREFARADGLEVIEGPARRSARNAELRLESYLKCMPPVLETEEPKLADGNGGGPRGPGPDDPADGGEGDEEGQEVTAGHMFLARACWPCASCWFPSPLSSSRWVSPITSDRSSRSIGSIFMSRGCLWFSTALILASGWTLEAARGALERKDNRRYVRWLEITVGYRLGVSGVAGICVARIGSAGHLSPAQSA